ncbi:hypothetical protein FQN60_006131 [Etheostoma spectabile]|uniref:Uncharacterized protein n=1 Tax=Etheostoma spectabile TaxID=54343 RepID=A0A5J5CPZ2_9PERO|nr:hypothetical protein FQN60_006131 [Etheostoma spectabile]
MQTKEVLNNTDEASNAVKRFLRHLAESDLPHKSGLLSKYLTTALSRELGVRPDLSGLGVRATSKRRFSPSSTLGAAVAENVHRGSSYTTPHL